MLCVQLCKCPIKRVVAVLLVTTVFQHWKEVYALSDIYASSLTENWIGERSNFLAPYILGSTGGSKSKSSGGVPRSRQSVVSSLPRTPKGEDILFRPPTVEPDSASSSEEYDDYDLEQEYLLPSIGPPAILQYMKESQNPPLSNEEVQDRQELAKNEMLMMSNSSGPCMFCKQEVLPFPTLDELERLTPDQVMSCFNKLKISCFTKNNSGYFYFFKIFIDH